LKYIGKGIPGKTNQVLTAGKGTFVGDITLPGICHLAVVRSPHAHARIKSIDTSAAEQLPGVITTITGEEIVRNTKPIPTHSSALGEKKFQLYALAITRFDTWRAGRGSCGGGSIHRETSRRIDQCDLRGFAPVVDAEKALEAGSALVVDEWGDNILSSRIEVHGDPDARIKEAAGTVRGDVRTQRYTGVSIEPRDTSPATIDTAPS